MMSLGPGWGEDVAKSREELLDHLYSSRKHCTLKDLEDALEAYGFEKRAKRKRSGNTHVWQRQGFIVVLHTPHGKFAKAGAVDDVIMAIELSEQARRSDNENPEGS